MAGEEQPIPCWIDKDFIERALREDGDNSNLTVASYEVKPATSAGDGYSSDMFRITAKLLDSQERQMILKCHPQGGLREKLMIGMNTFDKESCMLAETLPAMNNLLQKAAPGRYQPLSAKCLLHGNDPLKFLVMEDLRPPGFVMAKRQRGLDLPHCSLVMKNLARFHAASVALVEQNPTALRHYAESGFREQARPEIGAYMINAVEMLAKEISKWPGYEKYVRKVENTKDSFYDRIMELCTRKEDDFNVLIHGDFWTNNMLFRYSGNDPQEMRLVDFQLAHYTSPVLDLQYFLYTSPSDEVRANYLDHLIQEYHTTLMETLGDLGCSKRISLTQLHKKFKEYSFYGFFSVVGVLPIVLSKPEYGFDLEKSLTVSDSAQENKTLYSDETYVKAVKRLLPVFEANGNI